MDLDLADSMAPTRSVIGFGSVGCSDAVTELDELEDLLFGLDELLLEPLDLHLLVFVLEQLEAFVVVEQVVDLSAVDLVHRHRDCEVALLLLEVVDATVEQVLDGELLQALHGVSLAGASLSVSKHSYDARVEDQVQDWPDRVVVQLLV